jgi:hypothetical protein
MKTKPLVSNWTFKGRKCFLLMRNHNINESLGISFYPIIIHNKKKFEEERKRGGQIGL